MRYGLLCCFLLAACGTNAHKKVITSGFTKTAFAGHSYVIWQEEREWDTQQTITAMVHDPDCKCGQGAR